MSLKVQISEDLKTAMKARDQILTDTLRSILSGFTYKRTELGRDLNAEEEIAVVQKQVKQRNDSITEYTKAGRGDLAEKELKERDILMKYMPQQKSPDEIRQIVKEVMAGLPADGRNQGAVMKAVMPQVKGMADGNVVKQIVTEELAAK